MLKIYDNFTKDYIVPGPFAQIGHEAGSYPPVTSLKRVP